MKKKKGSKKPQKKGKKKLVKGLFILVGFLIIVLVLLLVVAYRGTDEKKEEGVKFFDIPDKCSLVMGNLVYQIRDEGDCRIHCANQCEVLEMKIKNSVFAAGNASCNICGCYCE